MSLRYQTNAAEKSGIYFRNPEKTKVLLIEDDRTTRRMVRASLKDEYELSVAANACLGASIYKILKPDIVLIDIDLPDRNGYALLRYLLKKDPHVHAIMFSGYGDTSNILKSMELGAKGFMLKPFDKDKMQVFMKNKRKEII